MRLPSRKLQVLGPKGSLLTNRVRENFTHGSVGGVGRKPGSYPAGNGGSACGFMVASGSAVPDLGVSSEQPLPGPIMLLVSRREGESAQQLFDSLRTRYDPRLEDPQFGPKYKIGPIYAYRGQRFSKICTYAGSLVIWIMLDTRKRDFDRKVIYRHDLEAPFRLLIPGGEESEIYGSELMESRDEADC